jgi:type III pantothenate kinase
MLTEITAYLLDAGNTNVKLGIVKNGEIISVKRFDLNSFPWKELDGNIPVVISSVLADDWKNMLEDFFQNKIYINAHMNIPYQLDYLTPETLGIDRLCNMAAVANKNPTKAKLVVDLGTCIKCDFMNEGQTYVGGSISPGLNMRAKSLETFTAKLPLIPVNSSAELIGKNTKESIESGVFNGWKAEITQMIQLYQTKSPDLDVYLTGGDARYFDFEQKSNIFVLEHLTLEGILEIYRLNEDSL